MESNPKEVSNDQTIDGTNVDNIQVNSSTAENEVTGDDNNVETNADTREDNADQNDEESEENVDIFSLMYGNDEEFDSDDEECIGLNTGTSDTNVVQNDIKRSSDSANSSKRRSDESDCPQNKRIKSEPLDKKPKQEIQKRLTTTIETVVEEEQPPVIPTNTLEFMSYLLELNAKDLDINDIKKFLMSRNLQNISQTFRFDNDFNTFRKIFIPYILTDLWQKLCVFYKQRLNNYVNVMDLKYFLSILTKTKSTKMKNGLEMKCISVIRPKEGSVFRFGQLITLQTAVQPKPNSTTHIITRRKYFGYITSHLIRGTNPDNQSEVNHLRLLSQAKNDCILVEEINFVTKYSEELYLRNDALIVAEPLICTHNSHLEARSVFKLEEFPVCRQVFSPIFTTKPSGLIVTVNERRFNATEVEIIQIGLDVVANSSHQNSCFMAINGDQNSNKSSILTEIIRQIVVCKGLGATKVLFTSSKPETLRNVDKILKSKKIKTYFIEKDFEKSLKEFTIKAIEHKLEKEKDPKQQELCHQCLNYLDGIQKTLSVECIVFKNSILERLRHELMSNCSVIIGRVQDLCNDGLFYSYFSQKNHFINCCVIDDSTHMTEPQLYSLFWFGITKFIFGGEYTSANPNGDDIFSQYGLNRSFFQRYYSLYKEKRNTYKDIQTTVFDV